MNSTKEKSKLFAFYSNLFIVPRNQMGRRWCHVWVIRFEPVRSQFRNRVLIRAKTNSQDSILTSQREEPSHRTGTVAGKEINLDIKSAFRLLQHRNDVSRCVDRCII